MGRHSHQVKAHREATSPRIDLGINYLNVENALEQKRIPRR
jgi:hypothetical protein